jgi:hypothetical protein
MPVSSLSECSVSCNTLSTSTLLRLSTTPCEKIETPRTAKYRERSAIQVYLEADCDVQQGGGRSSFAICNNEASLGGHVN